MSRHQLYDKYKRNKEAKKFYNSTAWQKCRAMALTRDHHLCQGCFKQSIYTPADMVHHIKDREDHPELALTLDNLISLCNSCHNKEHPEKGGGKKKKQRKIRVVECRANQEMI
ncbi:HNH endonuclease [Metabacillus fastidiosus]|uniref:HNH endonuclease n=1 Tax=Metabacillus fastidiosus TaxID=1458 RepID=UPI003D28D309